MTSLSGTDDRFGWTGFYMEFADRLLGHKNERERLVANVREVCSELGFSYLDKSGTAQDGKLPDICPFTTMGTFNRDISNANKKKVATEIARFLGVTGSVPDSFDGIPILSNRNSVAFWERKDIGPLWQVFEDAIRLADSDNGDARQSFCNSYNQILNARGVGRKVTMGLFWIRPHMYPSLDGKSEEYMTEHLGVELPKKIPPPGNEYLELADDLKRRFGPDFPVRSFQELSLFAYDEQPQGEEQGSNGPTGEPETPKYTLKKIIDDGCFLEQSKLEMILNRLKAKKNLILQGPPGTGKTWLAKKLAFALIGCEDDGRVRRFQFHPNMSYEDFVRGYRPDDSGGLTLTDGPFLKLIEDAEDDPDNAYVMVIEEINRGNPAQIFGEMLTLLEGDKRNPGEALTLAYPKYDGERVHVPPNVYVIGTMNVADRSIALVDLALRRRFAFADLEPTFGEVWRNWVYEQCGIGIDFLMDIERRMTELNKRIAEDRSLGPQFRVGHSVVTPAPGMSIANPAEWFKQVVETEIGPLLDEYWFDNTAESDSAKSALMANL